MSILRIKIKFTKIANETKQMTAQQIKILIFNSQIPPIMFKNFRNLSTTKIPSGSNANCKVFYVQLIEQGRLLIHPFIPDEVLLS